MANAYPEKSSSYPKVTPPGSINGLSSSDFSSVGSGDRSQEPEFRENVDKWRCPLCTRVVRNPVQTPCGHRFCDSCLTDYIGKHGDPTKCPANEEDCEDVSLKENTVSSYIQSF